MALSLFLLAALCFANGTQAQDTVRRERMERLHAVPDTVQKRQFLIARHECRGCLYPDYPNFEYIWLEMPWRRKLYFPEITRERYLDDKYWDDWWRLPHAVEVEEVDGKKVIKDNNNDDDAR